MQYKRVAPFIIVVLMVTALPCYGALYLGVKMSNTQTHDYWLVTPSPECGASCRWGSLVADGFWGSYAPSEDPEGMITLSRISLTPMIRLPWKNTFISAGYGVSGISRRSVMHDDDGALSISSASRFQGTLRCNAGIRLPFRPHAWGTVTAEYLYVDKQFRSFSIGLGVAVSPGPSDVQVASAVPNEEIRRAEKLFEIPELKPMPRVSLGISKVCVIRNADPIANELNSAIEVALIQAGFQVISWDKVASGAEQPLPSLSPNPGEGNADPQARAIQIALKKHASLDFSTAVMTSLRYTFKAYGGDVLVQSAYVKIMDLATGNVVWAGDFNASDASFLRCKQKLSEQTVLALKSVK
jgi:hypothetical protein